MYKKKTANELLKMLGFVEIQKNVFFRKEEYCDLIFEDFLSFYLKRGKIYFSATRCECSIDYSGPLSIDYLLLSAIEEKMLELCRLDLLSCITQ